MRGDVSKWDVNFAGFSREGRPACTMWHYKPEYGDIYLEQNNCKVLEADCRYHQAYTTICMYIPNAYVLPDVVCPVRNPLDEGTCWSGNWTLFFNDDDSSDDGIEDENVAHYQSWGSIRQNAII